MSNLLAAYETIPHPDGPRFAHHSRPWTIQLMPPDAQGGLGWVAWSSARSIVTNPDGSAMRFPSAARAAKYLENHHG